jgi:hypothetical protein
MAPRAWQIPSGDPTAILYHGETRHWRRERFCEHPNFDEATGIAIMPSDESKQLEDRDRDRAGRS